MNKTKLIPFDLERWQKGNFKRVVDICGTEITQLTYFKDVNDKRQLRGVRLSSIESWRSNGLWFDAPHAWDLQLEVEQNTLEGWVRVYKGRFGCSVFETESEARQYAENASDYITTIKIEYANDTN
jgi:hypothetical protein